MWQEIRLKFFPSQVEFVKHLQIFLRKKVNQLLFTYFKPRQPKSLLSVNRSVWFKSQLKHDFKIHPWNGSWKVKLLTWGINNLLGISSSWRRAQNSQETICQVDTKGIQIKRIMALICTMLGLNCPWINTSLNIKLSDFHLTFKSGCENTRRSWPSRTTRSCSKTLSWIAFA